MSTQINTYVLWGVVLDYRELADLFSGPDGGDTMYEFFEDYCDNAFKPEANPKDGLTCLFDGRDGKYVAVGHVAEKTENHHFLTAPVSFDVLNRAWAPPKAVMALGALLSKLDIDLPEPGWHVIAHWR